MAFAPEHRVDPVTGVVSLVVDLAGKPLPRVPDRVLPERRHPCPLCRLAADACSGAGLADDGDSLRPVLEADEHACTVPNRWPLYTPDGDSSATPRPGVGTPAVGSCDLVVTRRHVSAFEHLEAHEAGALIAQLHTRWRTLAGGARRTAMFAAVGVTAGASMEHLHAHIVASRLTSPGGWQQPTGDAVATDRAVSESKGLCLGDGPAAIWVPWAPATGGEIRLWAPNAREAGEALVETARRAARLTSWPYRACPI